MTILKIPAAEVTTAMAAKAAKVTSKADEADEEERQLDEQIDVAKENRTNHELHAETTREMEALAGKCWKTIIARFAYIV